MKTGKLKILRTCKHVQFIYLKKVIKYLFLLSILCFSIKSFAFSEEIDFSGDIPTGVQYSSKNRIVVLDDEYTLEKKKVTNVVDVYMVPNNALKVSLDTNQIIFEDVTGAENAKKDNALKVTVSSTLPYDIKASVENDIVGASYGETLSKSIVGLKANADSSYKNFSSSVSTLTLFENQTAGDSAEHNIDMSITTSEIKKADVYKIVLKVSVEQN
jgi:preprotein translocase subunit SecF